jgi:hypothetical protein
MITRMYTASIDSFMYHMDKPLMLLLSATIGLMALYFVTKYLDRRRSFGDESSNDSSNSSNNRVD